MQYNVRRFPQARKIADIVAVSETTVPTMSETLVSPWQTTLQAFAARFGDRVAVASRGRTLTYANLPRRPTRCAPR
jgi:hypothetical protein